MRIAKKEKKQTHKGKEYFSQVDVIWLSPSCTEPRATMGQTETPSLALTRLATSRRTSYSKRKKKKASEGSFIERKSSP